MLALYRPDILSRSVAPKRDHAKFAAAAAEYFGGKPNNEPYFRNEPVPELGFSFQNWVRYCCFKPLSIPASPPFSHPEPCSSVEQPSVSCQLYPFRPLCSADCLASGPAPGYVSNTSDAAVIW